MRRSASPFGVSAGPTEVAAVAQRRTQNIGRAEPAGRVGLSARGGPADRLLINLTLTLLVIGIVAVYDASYARSLDTGRIGNDGFYFLKRQALYAAIGILGMIGISRYGYWRLRRIAAPLLLASFALLVLVWVPHVGVLRNGAARWVGHGLFTVQPSELAKLVLIVYLAALLSRVHYRVQSWSEGLSLPLVVIALFVALVEREPDMGTAAIIFLSCVTLLYLAGAHIKQIGVILAVAGVLFMVVLALGPGYRGGRLGTWWDPFAHYKDTGYQMSRGLVAVGSGGIRGVGIGAGREKFYLPEANTDFIFATIAEELGLWGSVGVITLLFLLGRQGFVIARRTRDPFGALLAGGIAAGISWQAVMNVAVVTGAVPATGVPLPFISYGGSSLIFLLLGVGILLNISQHPDRPGRDSASQP